MAKTHFTDPRYFQNTAFCGATSGGQGGLLLTIDLEQVTCKNCQSYLAQIVPKVKTCDTCKHWGAQYTGACDAVDIQGGDKTKFDLLLEADDDQGLEGYVITGPEFGCVHHKGK